jgi:DNA polymerase-3 subunit epsilon
MKTKQEIIQDKDDAILFARQILAETYFVFDTETTGKDRNYDQIVQWAILTSTGKQFKSLAKATIPVSEGAYAIHHISDIDLENAPSILEVMGKILYHKNMICYNVQFDAGVLKNSLRANCSGLEIDIDKVTVPCDVMVICAAFRGEWSESYNDYRWHKLDFVCKEFGIDIDCSLHDAMSDAMLTEKIMKYIANQKLFAGE